MNSNVDCIEIDEGERIPNKFTLRTLISILAALLVACFLNEIGVFEADRLSMWIIFAVSVVFCGIAVYLVLNKRFQTAPFTKYVLVSMMLMLSLAVNVFFNISVVLLILLPMFIATRYRSRSISILAVVGSAICSVLAPILAWYLNAWSLNIMLGYLETTCKVTVIELGASTMSVGQVIFNLLVYLSLPQLMVIAIFGYVTLDITKNSISGMKNRVKVNQLSKNLENELHHVEAMQDHILFSMAEIIESRDNSTGGHVKRTSQVVNLILQAMHRDNPQQVSETFCESVVKAAPLHDIGKIAIDDVVLRKPGALTEQERLMIEKHPTKGAELISNVLVGVENDDFVRIAYNIAKYHHESYDGTGYPNHLKGDEIPLEARIMAIADIYDALVSKRCYKDALSPQEAFQRIEELMGTQFDPNLNGYFVSVLPEIEKYYSENNV